MNEVQELGYYLRSVIKIIEQLESDIDNAVRKSDTSFITKLHEGLASVIDEAFTALRKLTLCYSKCHDYRYGVKRVPSFSARTFIML